MDIENVQYVQSFTGNKSQFELFEGDILIAMTGAQIGKIGLMPRLNRRFLLNQRVGKLSPKDVFYKPYLYQIFSSDRVSQLVKKVAHGAAQPNISGRDIEDLPVIIPPSDLLKEYAAVCSPVLKQITFLVHEISLLKKMRDLLLPKLISGQINLCCTNIHSRGD